jgi:glycosyltransferase involved in cell wall biosynthesis
MRIGFISSYFYEKERMNFGTYPLIYNLIKGINAKEEVVVLANGYPKKPKTEFIDGIKVVRAISTKNFTYKLDYLTLLFKLKKFFGKGLDVINSQDCCGGAVFDSIKGTPKIYSVKGLNKELIKHNPKKNLSFKEKQINFFQTFWETACVKYSDYFIVPSNFTKQKFSELMNVSEEKIKVIPNGIDLNLFKPLNCDNGNTLFFAGGESYKKGADFVINAFIELKKEFTNLKLVVVGSKSLQRFKDKLNGFERDITTFSRVSHSNMASLLNESTIVLCPSLYENFGSVSVEAMACGKPVVSFNNSAINEVIGKAGVLVETGNQRDFTANIRDLLLSESKRKSLGNYARYVCEMNFDIKRVIKNYLNFFGEVII